MSETFTSLGKYQISRRLICLLFVFFFRAKLFRTVKKWKVGDVWLAVACFSFLITITFGTCSYCNGSFFPKVSLKCVIDTLLLNLDQVREEKCVSLSTRVWEPALIWYRAKWETNQKEQINNNDFFLLFHKHYLLSLLSLRLNNLTKDVRCERKSTPRLSVEILTDFCLFFFYLFCYCFIQLDIAASIDICL